MKNVKKSNRSVSEYVDLIGYATVYSWKKDATDEEVTTIYEASKDAWLHDENNYSICKFIDFLSENYFDKKISLEDISNANHWDIIEDTINDGLYRIKNVDKEMER